LRFKIIRASKRFKKLATSPYLGLEKQNPSREIRIKFILLVTGLNFQDSTIFVNLKHMMMSSKLWDNPDDFNPERFLNKLGQVNR